ncbi:hypothetical protein [Methanobrevibacter arboriphilus]
MLFLCYLMFSPTSPSSQANKVELSLASIIPSDFTPNNFAGGKLTKTTTFFYLLILQVNI